MSIIPDPSINYGLVSKALEPAAAVILITGLWASAAHSSAPRDLLMSITRIIFIVAVIANFDAFVNGAQGYVQNLIAVKLKATPDETASKYLDLVADKKSKSKAESSWSETLRKLLDPGVSVFEAIIGGILYLFSLVAAIVLFLAYAAQKLALQTAFAVAPLFLSFLGLQSTRAVAAKYILGVAGIVLWPLGWAIASLFTDSLLVFLAKSEAPTGAIIEVTLAYAFRDLFAAFLVGCWILISTIIAPVVIHGAITTGSQIGPGLASGAYKAYKSFRG